MFLLPRSEENYFSFLFPFFLFFSHYRCFLPSAGCLCDDEQEILLWGTLQAVVLDFGFIRLSSLDFRFDGLNKFFISLFLSSVFLSLRVVCYNLTSRTLFLTFSAISSILSLDFLGTSPFLLNPAIVVNRTRSDAKGIVHFSSQNVCVLPLWIAHLHQSRWGKEKCQFCHSKTKKYCNYVLRNGWMDSPCWSPRLPSVHRY